MPEPKKTLEFAPSLLVGSLGGIMGMVLLTALLFLAPALSLPRMDVPSLIGGILTGDETAALWLGYALFFLTGALLLPALLTTLLWNVLPGDERSLPGAALRGALFGAGLWVLTGLLLPLLGAASQVPALESPGLFAAGAGVAGSAWLALSHLLYGLAVALVAWMSQGLSPLDTLGWMGVGKQGARNEPA